MRKTGNYKHGGKGASEYSIWKNMRSRCNNPNNHAYARYGGRGIKVCKRWNDYANFTADMGPKPFAEASIDRIDNDKGYDPENCRWATAQEQARNRRNSFLVTFRGETKMICEWSEILGIDYTTLRYRLRRGLDAEQAFTRPLAHRRLFPLEKPNGGNTIRSLREYVKKLEKENEQLREAINRARQIVGMRPIPSGVMPK